MSRVSINASSSCSWSSFPTTGGPGILERLNNTRHYGCHIGHDTARKTPTSGVIAMLWCIGRYHYFACWVLFYWRLVLLQESELQKGSLPWLWFQQASIMGWIDCYSWKHIWHGCKPWVAIWLLRTCSFLILPNLKSSIETNTTITRQKDTCQHHTPNLKQHGIKRTPPFLARKLPSAGTISGPLGYQESTTVDHLPSAWSNTLILQPWYHRLPALPGLPRRLS